MEAPWCASEACRGDCSCVCAALPSLYIWLLLAPLILGSNQFFFDLPNTSLNQGPWLEQERKTGQKLRQTLFCLQGRAGRTETAPLFVCGVGLRATTTSLEHITFADDTDDSAKADINREQHRKFVIPNSDGTRSEVHTSTVNMPLMQNSRVTARCMLFSWICWWEKKNPSPLASSFFVPQGTAQLESDALQEFITCSIYRQLAELKRPAEKGSAAGLWKM